MSSTDPASRRDWLAAAGIPHRLGDPDLYARTHPYDPDAVTDEMLIAAAWRGESGGRFDRTILDVQASMAQGRTVYRRVQGNIYCECGREASVPPVDPFGAFICGTCWHLQQTQRAAEQIEADLQLRTQLRDLDELVPLWDDQVTGRSLRRPTYPRVAER